MQDNSIYEMISDIFITLKAHMAQQERENNQGLEVAKVKGKKLGRPKVNLLEEFIKEYTKFRNGDYGRMSAISFTRMIGIGRSTLYKYIKLYEDA